MSHRPAVTPFKGDASSPGDEGRVLKGVVTQQSLAQVNRKEMTRSGGICVIRIRRYGRDGAIPHSRWLTVTKSETLKMVTGD